MRLLIWAGGPLSPFEIFEICVTAFCIVLAFTRPAIGNRWFCRIERTLRTIAQRPSLCVAIVALLPIGCRLLLLPVYDIPTPTVQDEFAYLLQADTFASGRLSNPSPPLSRHFESPYILVRPSYTGEYQPAQPLVLATGQRLTGSPWAGVVVSMALLCAALYWALLGWLSSVWAFIGATLFGIEVGVLSYWMNSYWGGCVPAIGGALALGALARLRRDPRLSNSLLMTIGLIIVLDSRPLEGVLLSVIAGAAILYWSFFSKELSWASSLRRILPGVALALSAGIAFMGYYNERVTGSVTDFPYLLYRHRYAMPQGFLWQKPLKATTPLPADINAIYQLQLETHERGRSPVGFARLTAKKIRRMWVFYVGVPLTVPLLFLPFIWSEANMMLAFVGLFVVVGLDNMTFFDYFPHYSGAVTVLIVLALAQCLRRMRMSGRPGLFLSRSLPIVCALGLTVSIFGRFLEPWISPEMMKLWQHQFSYPAPRAKFEEWLEKQAGQQLVFVRYISSDLSDKTSLFKSEKLRRETGWVYNLADLSASKVIWARELDPESNRRLVDCFPGRKVWLAEPEQDPPRLRLYTDTASLRAANTVTSAK